MLTREQLVAVMPRAAGIAGEVVEPLRAAMERFEIDRPARVGAFLAQLAHESGQLQRWSENLSYRWERLRQVFPRYFRSDAEAQAFDRQPERIANRVYGGRMGNGPEASGDGWRYRGRGPIQLTGKDNYRACGAGLGLDLVARPELVETREVGCLAAAWFWARNGLNALADAGDLVAITRRINGGLHGLAERRAFWERAQEALAVGAPVPGSVELERTAVATRSPGPVLGRRRGRRARTGATRTRARVTGPGRPVRPSRARRRAPARKTAVPARAATVRPRRKPGARQAAIPERTAGKPAKRRKSASKLAPAGPPSKGARGGQPRAKPRRRS